LSAGLSGTDTSRCEESGSAEEVSSRRRRLQRTLPAAAVQRRETDSHDASKVTVGDRRLSAALPGPGPAIGGVTVERRESDGGGDGKMTVLERPIAARAGRAFSRCRDRSEGAPVDAVVGGPQAGSWGEEPRGARRLDIEGMRRMRLVGSGRLRRLLSRCPESVLGQAERRGQPQVAGRISGDGSHVSIAE